MKGKSNRARIIRISKACASLYWVLSLILLVGSCNEYNPMWFCLLLVANFVISSFLVHRVCDAWY